MGSSSLVLSRIDPDFPPAGGGRRLATALAISLALHGLGLLLLPGYSPTPADDKPQLTATLFAPPAAPAAAEAHAPPAAAPVALPNQAPPPAPVERTYGQNHAPAPSPAAPADAAAPAAASAPAPAEGEATPAPEAAAPPQPPHPGVDVAGLRQYHAALGRVAGRFRRYPPQARAAGWEGRVIMRLAISEAGTPSGLVLATSSGFTILDQAALEMMNLAANHTAVPDSLRGRAFTIDLAVDYNLTDDR